MSDVINISKLLKDTVVFVVLLAVGYYLDIIALWIHHLVVPDDPKHPLYGINLAAVGLIQVVLNLLVLQIVAYYKLSGSLSGAGLMLSQSIVLSRAYGTPFMDKVFQGEFSPQVASPSKLL
jgi:hypothetical protein